MQPGRRITSADGGWRPDFRASLGLAAAAACLVMTGFIALFSSVPPLKLYPPGSSVREELVLAEPAPALARARRRAHLQRSRLPVQLPELPRMPPPSLTPLRAPDSFSLQDYLDQRAKDNARALRERVTGSELKRDLGRQTEQPALSDDQSYRTVDGQRVERGGGGCTESQTQQGSSSPTNHFEVARPISCPGAAPDASRQMGKALEDWAQKHRAPPPPP